MISIGRKKTLNLLLIFLELSLSHFFSLQSCVLQQRWTLLVCFTCCKALNNYDFFFFFFFFFWGGEVGGEKGGGGIINFRGHRNGTWSLIALSPDLLKCHLGSENSKHKFLAKILYEEFFFCHENKTKRQIKTWILKRKR